MIPKDENQKGNQQYYSNLDNSSDMKDSLYNELNKQYQTWSICNNYILINIK